MKKRMILGLCVFALMGWLAVGPAHAQETGKISVFAGYSYQLDNLGGNNCSFSYDCANGSLGIHGYTAAVTYNFTKNIGFEANLAGHNGGGVIAMYGPTSQYTGDSERQTQDIYTYTFGPKVTLPVGNFSLFTHFLVGAMHANLSDTATCVPSTGVDGNTCSSVNAYTAHASGNGMAFKTGAGADWNHGRWGLRILEVDYIHGSTTLAGSYAYNDNASQAYTNGATANNFELSTGFKFNF